MNQTSALEDPLEFVSTALEHLPDPSDMTAAEFPIACAIGQGNARHINESLDALREVAVRLFGDDFISDDDLKEIVADYAATKTRLARCEQAAELLNPFLLAAVKATGTSPNDTKEHTS